MIKCFLGNFTTLDLVVGHFLFFILFIIIIIIIFIIIFFFCFLLMDVSWLD